MKLSCIVIAQKAGSDATACVAALPEAVGADDSLEVLIVFDGVKASVSPAPDNGVIVIEHAAAEGFAACANKAAEQATGELCFFVAPEIIPAPGSLKRLTEYLRDNPKTGVACGVVTTPDGEKLPTARRFPGVANAFLRASGLAEYFDYSFVNCLEYGRKTFSYPADIAWASFAFAVLRKNVMKRLGPFDERFSTPLAGADLCLRARASLVPSLDVKIIPQARAVNRESGSASRQTCRNTAFCLPECLGLAMARDTVLFNAKRHGAFYAFIASCSALLGGVCRWLVFRLPLANAAQRRKDASAFLSATGRALVQTQSGTRLCGNSDDAM